MKHLFDTRSIHIVAYNSDTNDITLNHDFEGQLSVFDAQELTPSLLCTIQKKLSEADQHVVFIDAQCVLPAYWLTRLITSLVASERAVICSALTTQAFQLSPLASGTHFKSSPERLDKLVYYLQSAHSWFETDYINHSCFVVNIATLGVPLESILDLALEPLAIACNHLLIQTPAQTKTLKTSNIPNISDQNPLAAHPLANIQYQLDGYMDQPMPVLPDGWLQLDTKPVVLHMSTDWGGGMGKWVNDFCETESEYHHLVLLSQGEFFRQRYGEQFSLRLGSTQGIEIAHFDLSVSITSTVTTHTEYQRLLVEIVDRYHIQGIFVSTLIGHSMDCLRTGLPTIRIFHDYFPDWPALPALLDDENPNLGQALQQRDLFGEISSTQYTEWQQALIQDYQQNNVTLLAPNQSVADNLQKISAETIYQTIHIIPHGIHLFSPIEYKGDNTQFTILLPGKVGIAKGSELLAACLPAFSQYRIILLGAGEDHNNYSQYENVEIVENYQTEELPALLLSYQPDVAMLLSIASETFSYTLSEMMQAGIPVIATDRGALKQRIKNEETGFIVAADENEIHLLIKKLAEDKDALSVVRDNLRAMPQQTLQQMIPQYRALWAGRLECKQTYSVVAADRQNEARLSQQVLQFKQLSEQKVAIIDTQLATIEERTAWALTVQAEKEQGEQAYEQRLKAYEKSAQDQELISIYNSHSWKITEPLRMTRRTLSAWQHKLRFRWTKIQTYPSRVINSLASRGLKGTTGFIYNKLTHPIKQADKMQHLALTNEYTAFLLTGSETPQVSIIIPVYNQFIYTYNCLLSLTKLDSKVEIEVIVVDDCSTDETSEKIQMISGIRYHRQAENGGFIESCNQGAALARGEYVLFLNNDTVVQDNWLDSLLAVFDDFPDAGLVGSKLVYPDGSLQEAGGIIFSDASGWNVGRGGDPAAPEYNFVREVDYCSGASIIIRRDLFEKLGKFDVRYKPAYYEDTDLAFAVRSVGQRVYYQPASVVIHFEGVTSGTDLSSGVKRYQVINQEKFKDKWQQALLKQTKPTGDIESSRLYNQPKRVLIYDACIPTPDQDSGSLRMINLVQILQDLDYHIVFMAENMPFTEGYTTALQQMGVECLYRPHVNSPLDYLKGKGQYLDAVIVSRYYIAAPIMKMLRQYCPDATIVFDTVDLHYLREQRLAEFEQSDKLAAVAEKTRSKELAVIEQADITLVVSSFEQEFLAKEAPQARVDIVSNIHKIHGRRKDYQERKDIMFVGGYQHPPNVDAIVWFAKEVFPLIRQILDIQLHIIGSKAPKEVEVLQEAEGIVFHGFVENIEPFMDDCRIAVAPLRYGAGVKGKVNMSMSYGQPVVATGIAAEGMQLENGHDIVTADSEADFAQAVIRLYNDSELWQKISDNGLENVTQWFSFNAAKQAIKTVLEK